MFFVCTINTALMQNNSYAKTAPGYFVLDGSVFCTTGVILARYRESFPHDATITPEWGFSSFFEVSACGALQEGVFCMSCFWRVREECFVHERSVFRVMQTIHKKTPKSGFRRGDRARYTGLPY